MEAKPRPLIGALLGATTGLVVVVLLAVLGVVPPDQLVLFGIVGVLTFVVAWMLTQRVALARTRFIVVAVIAALLTGFGLAGIPQFAGGGSIEGGCTAQGTSSLEPPWVTPEGTSAMNPFDVAPDDTVGWEATSGGAVITDWTSAFGVNVGGFFVEFWRGESENADEDTEWSGEEDVASIVNDVEGASGITVSGVVLLQGSFSGDGGECSGAAYVRVAPESAFDGWVLTTLWIVLAILVILIIVMIIVVRRSISAADKAPVGPNGAPFDDGFSAGTGGSGAAFAAVGGAAAGAAASDGETPAERYDRDMKHFDDLEKQDDADEDARNRALHEQLEDGRMDGDASMDSVFDARALGDALEADSPDTGGAAGGDDTDSGTKK